MHPDDHDAVATPQEACREYAWNMGAEHPEQAWLITSYDTWESNPHYTGPPQRHPEDDPEDEFCTGPYCTPIYDAAGRQTGIDCVDCPICDDEFDDGPF